MFPFRLSIGAASHHVLPFLFHTIPRWLDSRASSFGAFKPQKFCRMAYAGSQGSARPRHLETGYSLPSVWGPLSTRRSWRKCRPPCWERRSPFRNSSQAISRTHRPEERKRSRTNAEVNRMSPPWDDRTGRRSLRKGRLLVPRNRVRRKSKRSKSFFALCAVSRLDDAEHNGRTSDVAIADIGEQEGRVDPRQF